MKKCIRDISYKRPRNWNFYSNSEMLAALNSSVGLPALRHSKCIIPVGIVAVYNLGRYYINNNFQEVQPKILTRLLYVFWIFEYYNTKLLSKMADFRQYWENAHIPTLIF